VVIIAMKIISHWVWWGTPVSPALRRLKQEDHKFKATLDYIVRPCLRKTNNEQ
jgi:hypothetical protein